MIRSATAVAALLSVVLATMALPAAAQDLPEARGLDRVCPPPTDTTDEATADAPFPDAGTTHAAAIACAAAYGLVSGFPDGTFRPDAPLTRGQMASVLRSFIEVATPETLPVPDADPFPDIGATVHRDAIAALAAADVVAGRQDGTYDANTTVTRGQVARFILTALGFASKAPGSFPPAADSPTFDDTINTAFQADIQALAAAGIVQGTGPDSYRPNDAVTRGQLASLLLRAADLLAEEGLWQLEEPARTALDITIELTGEQVLDLEGGELVDGKGQPGAVADLTLVLDPQEGTVGYVLDLGNIAGGLQFGAGARIQRGPVGVNGPAVLVLATGSQLEASPGIISGVLEDRDVADNDVGAAIDEILADPTGFYVTVRSNEFGNGAVRGQLTTD